MYRKPCKRHKWRYYRSNRVRPENSNGLYVFRVCLKCHHAQERIWHIGGYTWSFTMVYTEEGAKKLREWERL